MCYSASSHTNAKGAVHNPHKRGHITGGELSCVMQCDIAYVDGGCTCHWLIMTQSRWVYYFNDVGDYRIGKNNVSWKKFLLIVLRLLTETGYLNNSYTFEYHIKFFWWYLNVKTPNFIILKKQTFSQHGRKSCKGTSQSTQRKTLNVFAKYRRLTHIDSLSATWAQVCDFSY